MTVNMYIATVAWLLLLLGYAMRRNRAIHVPLMLLGISSDILLVLYLQLTKSAVETALSFSLSSLQQLHIACSSVALILYFPVLFLGFTLLRGRATKSARKLHVRLASTALVFRTLGFFLMFSMLGR